MGNTLEKPQLHQTDDPIFTCEICIEPVSSTQKFGNKNMCSHPFCVDCMIKYIEVKVEENVSQIPCPALQCNNIFDPVSLQPLLSETAFTKWCDLLCDSTLLKAERCYCPHTNCSALVINECGGDVKKAKCPNCKGWFCFKCSVTWHAGFKCEERREMRDGNDVAFGELAEQKRWKRCPRCRHYVERIAGCNSMYCRCGSVFCYRCGNLDEGVLICQCDQPMFCGLSLPIVILVFGTLLLLGFVFSYTIYSMLLHPPIQLYYKTILSLLNFFP